jgi:multifunctional beta-oxidation protein
MSLSTVSSQFLLGDAELTALFCVEIKAAGGNAVADYNSVVDGDKIIETAVKAFGTVHVLINNAGTDA